MAEGGDPLELRILPLLEEVARIERRRHETGRVRISIGSTIEERRLHETLRGRRAEVERVPVGREVPEPPPLRQEGDTIIIPVMEERLVVERRLVLREELRLRIVATEEEVELSLPLRRQSATIERLPATASAGTTTGHPTTNSSGEVFSMTYRTITALFDGRAEAERAAHALASIGVDRERVQIHAQEGAGTGTAPAGSGHGGGFLSSLANLFMPDEDRATYSEGIRRGGVLVSAEVPEEKCESAMGALESAGAVDIDAREAEWRQSGWTGGGVMPGASSQRPGDASTDGRLEEGRTEAIPLAEEHMRVGKRVAEAGRVRVRSYVVETPVEEQVTLREEHVSVERRPADRPATEAEAALFQDRTIEATESAEEPVVAKDVRVREEVEVRKEGTERTETVRDTVRHTEVEVDDDRRAAGKGTKTGTGPAPGTSPAPERDRDR